MVHAGALGEEGAAPLVVVREAAGGQDRAAAGVDGDVAPRGGDHGSVDLAAFGEQACGGGVDIELHAQVLGGLRESGHEQPAR